MTDALPNGLVKTNSNVTEELGNLEKVRIEDIAQLWRVYTTNKSVLEENTGRRLENLFWRIWGSERLFQNIGGSTVAKIFCYISDSSPRIWTTPVQSPLGNRNFPQLEEIPHLPRSPSPELSLKPLSPVSDATTVRPPLTPILKSTRKGSPRKGPVSFDSATSGRETGKHARFLTEEAAPSPQVLDKPPSAAQKRANTPTEYTTSEKQQDAPKILKSASRPQTITKSDPSLLTPLPAPVVGFSTPSIPSTMSNYTNTSTHLISKSPSSTAMLRTNSQPTQPHPSVSASTSTSTQTPLFTKVPITTLSSRRSSDKSKTPSTLLNISSTPDPTSALSPNTLSSAILEDEPTTSASASASNAPIPFSPATLPIRQNVSSLTLSIDASRQRGEFISQDEIERRRGGNENARKGDGQTQSQSQSQAQGRRKGRGKVQ